MITKMKYILCAVCLFGGLTAYAQDDESADYDDQVTTAKKKTPAKVPTYPMMEVQGICVDAATKAPLSGIMIKTLGNDNYTAMTDESGEFVIKVPTFATSLYVHAPEYLSQQVAIGNGDAKLKISMIADKYRAMYDNGTNIQSSAVAKIQNTTSMTIETDIEGSLGADVRSISRSGGPGYGAAMFVRGLNSLTANAQPLIVVDGIVRDMQQNRSAVHYGDYINLMLNINPEDIEKVTVLKNATAL